jgi:FMN phosphatase YigB (HAD superfamily)
MTPIRHVVFDLGRVLIHWEPELPYHRLIPDATERRRFLTEVCNARWLIETDLGGNWFDAERELIARYPADEAMIRAFREHWHEMVPGFVDGTPLILSELISHGYDVTALTNFADDTFDEAADRFPLLKSFRGVTISARVKLVKPDEAIFKRHAEDFALAPQATLFFDDTPANVAAAKRAGWQAELFTDAETMRGDLRRHGVRIE